MDINNPAFWPTCLEQLELSMTRATYNQILRDATARPENGHLLVEAKTEQSVEWLKYRLNDSVKRVAATVAGGPVEVEYGVKGEERPDNEAQLPLISVTGTYRDKYNEIVQPNRNHYTSWYFHKYWLPILGPELWLLIWELRTRCWRDRETGRIVKDTVEISYKELGEAIDVGQRTLIRLLNPKKPEDQATLKKFIISREVKRRHSKSRGGTVNEKTIFKIRLDDPLIPRHEEMLADSLGDNLAVRESSK